MRGEADRSLLHNPMTTAAHGVVCVPSVSYCFGKDTEAFHVLDDACSHQLKHQ